MSDYKQRMIREHRELQERISKLAHMLEGYAEARGLHAACSFQLLESQLYAMGTYANILQERARIEQVDLNAPLEGGESGEVATGLARVLVVGARSRRNGSGTACSGCLNTRSLS